MTEQIHWHEGLFLQPHHLQTWQRQIHDRFMAEGTLSRSYPYGVIETDLSADALENMLLRFEQLEAVMPSGVYIRQGHNADVPALDITQAFNATAEGLTVYLGVPLWYANRANVVDESGGDDAASKRMYRVVQSEVADENTGANPQPIPMRRINARLLLDTDDASDMERLPIMRIARATNEDSGLPRRDTRFAPPCLHLKGSAALLHLVRDLANQIEASRKELLLQMSRGGFRVENMRGIHFEQMLRLQALNRHGPCLTHLVQAQAVTPFDVYLELRRLLGALAALYPETDMTDVPDYRHDDPLPAFNACVEAIRSMLRGAVKPSFLQVDFVAETGMQTAPLSDEHLTQPNEYYLGIRTDEDPKTLIELVEDRDRFKLMAKSMISRAIWGIQLNAERVPPLELPSRTGLHMFRLDISESARMWERIKQEKEIAATWPGVESTAYTMALYMTVPNLGS
jgi:type VI secretion system protein ImpJ